MNSFAHAFDSNVPTPDSTREAQLRIGRAGAGWCAEGSTSHDIARTWQHGSSVTTHAGWQWNGRRLEVRTDRYGQAPLFYSADANGCRIATSIPQLLTSGVSAELDYRAIAVFMRFGSFLGSDTAFRCVRAVPPGAILHWQDGELMIEAKCPAIAEHHIARPAAIDGYIDLFRQAIQRCSPGNASFAVPLSGGRDSRHILFELFEQGHRPRLCVTARYFPPGDTGQGEVDVAARVAGTLGLPHRVVDPVSPRWRAERRSFLETSYSSLDAAWTFSVADALAGEVDLVYDGIAGDVLSAGLMLNECRLELFRKCQFDRLADDFLAAEPNLMMLDGAVRALLSRSAAVERVVEELEHHSDAPNPVGSFIFWNRTRRHIAAHTWALAKVTQVITPYQDHNLFDFLSGLPAEMFLDHTFHTQAIHRAYPQYADLAFSTKQSSTALRESRRAARQYAADLIRVAARRETARLARSSFFVPRLLRCLVDRSYQDSVNWLGPVFLYLVSLEEAQQGEPNSV